ncbi:MAG: hypothetical protein JW836_14915 [Deltaproteobacteria bacterium]|nr:hypothetical protein [Deltaproteobacteria bacterium]
MAQGLKRIYLALIIPAISALFLAYGAKEIGLIPTNKNISLTLIAPCVFVLSVALAVALPIFIRSLFAHAMRHQKTVPEPTLIKFERRLMIISLMTPYLILPAYLLDFPNFYFTATVLMALYAAYYFYPSEKRIQFERRLFRVQ